MSKQFIFLLFLIPFTFTLLAQDKTAYELSHFDELVVIGNFPVNVIQSDKKEAIVEDHGNDIDLENLSFSYTKNTLTVKYSGSFVDNIDIQLDLYINAPIKSVEARRGAEIRIKEAGSFDKNVSYKSDAGGKLLIENINATLVKAEVTKGGSIRLIGKTESFEPTVKTGGTIAAVNLKAKEVDASVSLGGEIICSPIKTLNAKVTSGGTINYTGNPKVKEKVTLGGKIEKL
ncbi:hypothetical protein CW751_08690 [Brumimicrobium salinarum]|uniref:Putative auto-transporter adhesin head GIN domain-containing protein n=1 Tax=Brumimicrobium salinarum TaxID=2058658 RepID=A0A2I0R2M1_9FLAO|nr:DUF2807 domain-containing protein [Brumimicrobium salinarum]PKR80834.1 hypothetical protein CW751_08690 [Brumimicrobium salinarum]